MSCRYRICFTLGHRRFCVCIPLLYQPFSLKDLPDPPFDFPGLSKEDARAIQVLASIGEMSKALPSAMAKDFEQSVATQLQTIGKSLGEGVELGR